MQILRGFNSLQIYLSLKVRYVRMTQQVPYAFQLFWGSTFRGIGSFFSFPFTNITYTLLSNKYLIDEGYQLPKMQGYIDATYHIYHTRGALGFYGKGFRANLYHIIMTQAMIPAFSKLEQSDSKLLKFFGDADVSSLLIGILSYPITLGVIGAVNDSQNKYEGLFDILKKVVSKDGFLALFTGLGAYLIANKIFPLIKKFIIPQKTRNSAGMLISSPIIELMLFPFEYIQIRMILALLQGKPYEGMFNCLTSIVDKQGFKTLFIGSTFKMIKIIFVMLFGHLFYQTSKAVNMEQSGHKLRRLASLQRQTYD